MATSKNDDHDKQFFTIQPIYHVSDENIKIIETSRTRIYENFTIENKKFDYQNNQNNNDEITTQHCTLPGQDNKIDLPGNINNMEINDRYESDTLNPVFIDGDPVYNDKVSTCVITETKSLSTKTNNFDDSNDSSLLDLSSVGYPIRNGSSFESLNRWVTEEVAKFQNSPSNCATYCFNCCYLTVLFLYPILFICYLVIWLFMCCCKMCLCFLALISCHPDCFEWLWYRIDAEFLWACNPFNAMIRPIFE